MSEKNIQLQNAISYSETMLKNAEAGNWDKVIDIEVQRSELLEKLFSSTDNIDEMDDKIRKIIDINKKLETITLNARESARTELSSINKGRHAVNVYAQNGM